MAGAESDADQLRIIVFKGLQRLELHRDGVRIKSYRVCLGQEPSGHKTMLGDNRTPEGEYFICFKNANSKFHRFLGISYPGGRDAARGFERGMISLETRNSIIRDARARRPPSWDTKLGGWVGIHGYPTDPYLRRWVTLLYPKPHNWTEGCIAMWNFEIDELFSIIPVGTPVSILP
jgi:murein L,D-transpeptidase YafK